MRLDHINIVTPDLDETVKFFEDILGLSVGNRPPFKFPGAWLYGEDDELAIVHLSVGDDRGGPTGNLDHVSFYGQDRTGLIERLDNAGIAYDARVVPGSGVHQIFFMAPFGLKIEVDFAPDA